MDKQSIQFYVKFLLVVELNKLSMSKRLDSVGARLDEALSRFNALDSAAQRDVRESVLAQVGQSSDAAAVAQEIFV